MPGPMNNEEAIEIMNRCKDEIMDLHGVIDRLKPKADAYDNIATILRLVPQPPIVIGERLVWSLDKRIWELKQSAPEAGE